MEWDELPILFPSFESSDEWLPLLRRHLELLAAADAHTRVTSVAPEDAVRRHYAESLELWRVVIETTRVRPVSVIDVGSGGGYPGLVMACIAPDIHFSLVEPLQKRGRLLESLAGELKLRNVSVFARRAEEAGRGELRGSADVVVARAVAGLPVLLEYTVPLAKVGGTIVLPKGSGFAAELGQAVRAMTILGCHAIPAVTMRAEISATLTVGLFLKDRGTPSIYPRQPGTPAKIPL